MNDAAAIPKLCGSGSGIKDHQYLTKLPAALFAGSRAIGLRLRVSALYAQGLKKKGSNNSSDAGSATSIKDWNATHLYFIDILKDCHFRLSRWHNTAVALANEDLLSKEAAGINLHQNVHSGGNGSSTRTCNYFDILSDDDLHVMDDIISGGQENEMAEAANHDLLRNEASSVAAAETKIQDVDKDLGELKVVIICFMMDLLDAVKQVEKIWKRVRKEDLSILTAGAMTSVALQSMDEIYANMTLQFPSVQVASDLLFSDAGLFISADSIGTCELSDFYNELLLYYRVMCYFRDQLLVPYEKHPSPADDGINFRRMAYDRNREKIPVLIEFYQLLPMTEPAIRNFLCTELTNIFNKCYQNRDNYDSVFHSFPIMKDFLKDFLDFFETKKITAPTLLPCVCWLKIVSILQSKTHLTLGRTVYMARMHSRQFMACIKYDDPVLADLVEAMGNFGLDVNEAYSENNFPIDEYELYHVNPYLAGAHALDMQCSAAYTRGTFKISGQLSILYTALRQEGFLKESVPFLDEFIEIFKTYMFGSDAQPPEKGKYFSTMALKCNFSAEMIRCLKGFQPTRFNRFRDDSISVFNSRRVNKEINELLIPLSHLAGWLTKKDMSSAAFSAELDLQATLDMVERLADHELYHSKLLNLHGAKTMRVFNSFCARMMKKLPYLAEQFPFSLPVNHFGTIAHLICPQLCLSTVKYLDGQARLDKSMNARCVIIATEMQSFFSSFNLESTLCTFPPIPLRRTDVFGRIVPGNVIVDLNKMPSHMLDFENEYAGAYFEGSYFADEIEALMLPRADHEHCKAELISNLKSAIMENPLILQFVFEDSHLFPSLLDYALCGPIQDADLAEWLIQMKGLSLRGLQLTRMSLGKSVRKITSKSHLQIACLHSNTWAIRLIHAATQAIDINFCPRDDPSGDSALHHCCRLGDMEHVALLYNDQICFPNADGKLPMEVLPKAVLSKLGPYTFVGEDEVKKMHLEKFLDFQLKGHKTEEIAKRRAARVSKQLKREAKDANPVVTEADIKRAAEAEKALLDMLDQEDAFSSTKKAKKVRETGKKSKNRKR